MGSINLRDPRNRDAVVGAQSVRQTAIVRYVDKDGGPAKLCKVLKGTLETGYDALLAEAGDMDKLGAALATGDPELDMERIGMFLNTASRVWINDHSRIVFRIVQTEVVRAVDGMERERRPRKRAPSNLDSDIPLSWTGRKVKKADALRRFVFFRKLQIVHVNGLTYDFLYGMAKELAEADSLMLLGAGASGKEPLIMSHGGTPCRGFLEGRIDDDRYVLLLHLSKMELKRPAPIEAVAQPAATETATAPTPAPAAPEPPASSPATRKPTVEEVLAATQSAPTPRPAAAKEDLRETIADAKTKSGHAKSKKVAAAVDATAPASGSATTTADGTPAKPARKRAPRGKPAGTTPAE